MTKVRVSLGEKSYDVVVGRDLLTKVGGKLGRGEGRLAVLFFDSRLAESARALEKALRKSGWRVGLISARAHEKLKDLKTISGFYGRLSRMRADRTTVLIALGGGVIGDAGGFLAGTYMRGIPWIGIPSTLLAQVDSAIGGKTAVNLRQGKNLVGVFHQPSFVACDVSLLKTLSERDRISGMGEVIKYALIRDPGMWKRMSRDEPGFGIMPETRLLEEWIVRCARIKGQIVSADERDRLGLREVLNFGHTIGHALEAEAGFDHFRHGEAVILGMRAAIELSKIRGHLPAREAEKLHERISSIPVPRVPKFVTASSLIRRIQRDKKARAGKVRFVLLKGIGKTVLDSGVSDSEIRRSLGVIT